MRIGRIPYINCYPVYGAIDRGVVPLEGEIVDGVPSELNGRMASGLLDVSVVSAVEYARDAARYLLLPDLAISCDGPVRSVLLFSKRPAGELTGHRVLLTRSSMTSVALLRMLFEHVWHAAPDFAAGDAEVTDIHRFGTEEHEARLVIGDAALLLGARRRGAGAVRARHAAHDADGTLDYAYVYDLGEEWKRWTGLPFVFAVWVAQRTARVADALAAHAQLIESRDWGLSHLSVLATQAANATGVARRTCLEYLSGLDYRLSYAHLAGLTDFFRRLADAGQVPNGSLAFLPAA
ncbi:MAG TPA: menaquinone biosynthesis protein [Gemmatimonadaceae bacterium]|nr:menaquinone biosynthesis protein [Gemmatimonadaceae bacterium]